MSVIITEGQLRMLIQHRLVAQGLHRLQGSLQGSLQGTLQEGNGGKKGVESSVSVLKFLEAVKYFYVSTDYFNMRDAARVKLDVDLKKLYDKLRAAIVTQSGQDSNKKRRLEEFVDSVEGFFKNYVRMEKESPGKLKNANMSNFFRFLFVHIYEKKMQLMRQEVRGLFGATAGLEEFVKMFTNPVNTGNAIKRGSSVSKSNANQSTNNDRASQKAKSKKENNSEEENSNQNSSTPSYIDAFRKTELKDILDNQRLAVVEILQKYYSIRKLKVEDFEGANDYSSKDAIIIKVVQDAINSQINTVIDQKVWFKPIVEIIKLCRAWKVAVDDGDGQNEDVITESRNAYFNFLKSSIDMYYGFINDFEIISQYLKSAGDWDTDEFANVNFAKLSSQVAELESLMKQLQKLLDDLYRRRGDWDAASPPSTHIRLISEELQKLKAAIDKSDNLKSLSKQGRNASKILDLE